MAIKQNLIGAEWRDGKSVMININPSDIRDEIGQYAQGSAADIDDAANAAKLGQMRWLELGMEERADILDKIGTEILSRERDLGTLLSREEGKTLNEGIGEATRAGRVFKFFAGECFRNSGEQMDSIRNNVNVQVHREPVGVVGIITPWNFPLAIPAWKIAPALAYGNAVVFKPAELVPGCAWALADIINRSGIPSGVFNMVMGTGGSVGNAIVNNSGIDAISFTGSARTGAIVGQGTAKRSAKLQMEMGGKNPLVIMEDADLESAVECAVNGAFFQTGQRCTASSRLIVQKDIHDQFIDRLVERVKNLNVGHALHPDTDIGPVVDQRQLHKDLSYLEIGAEEGATLVCGGEQPTKETDGFFLTPALFTETTNDMRINREEIFGPIATVIRVNDFEEAVTTANDTRYGLSSGICTTSLKYANEFRRRSEAGMVMVNLPTAGVDYHVPFGGRKHSSFGTREQGRYAVEFYTDVKTTYVN